MKTIRAVFFDFGGTLFSYELLAQSHQRTSAALAEKVNAEPDRAAIAYRSGMARAGREFSRKPFYLHRDMFAAGTRYALQELGKTLDEQSIHDFVSWLNSIIMDTIVPRPGLHTVLRQLRENSLHVGGASNADIEQFEPMVEALQVRALFDSLMCSEQVGSCKPDSEFFYAALRQADCEPSEAVYVGDTPMADIVGAQQVGMHALLIEEASDLVIDRGPVPAGQATIKELGELFSYLDEINSMLVNQ